MNYKKLYVVIVLAVLAILAIVANAAVLWVVMKN